PSASTAAARANSVGHVPLHSITELDGTGPQPVPIATGVLFEVAPSDERPDHPVGGARTQSTETSNLVDTPLRDIEETLDDVEGARDDLGPRTLHALGQRRIRQGRKPVCQLYIRPSWGVNETHAVIKADNTQTPGVSWPLQTPTFVTTGTRDSATHVCPASTGS
ncbi:MAG: hypothetical protein ACI89G_000639, partial [Minisyncoccia bacterium]